MDTGTPCRRTISLIYNWAHRSTRYVDLPGMKWVVLVSMSTPSQIMLKLRLVLGKPKIRSIQTVSHSTEGHSWAVAILLALSRSLHLFAGEASTYGICYVLLHPWPPITSFKILIHLCTSMVEHVRSIMGFRHNIFQDFLVTGNTRQFCHNRPLSEKIEYPACLSVSVWLHIFLRCSSDFWALITCFCEVGYMVICAIWAVPLLITTSIPTLFISSCIISYLVIIVDVCTTFLLNASATTLAFPRWYKILMS